MNNLLIIGAGGVGRVVTHKCAGLNQVFSKILLASRTLTKCEAIASELDHSIQTRKIDADHSSEVATLIGEFGADIVINVALPYQDLSIMDACLQSGAHYLDTANYEPPSEAKFSYEQQWAYRQQFKEAGLMALLGSGFDPGVTSVFCAYAQKHHFDEIHQIDIVDCNAGDHGYAFATNFNPEINIREVSAKGRYWEDGQWIETEPMELSRTIDFSEGIGPKRAYLIYHEELESLVKNINGLKKIRFWMTFSDSYLEHLRVLQAVGMTSIHPIDYNGTSIVPLQFLKTLLPDPAALGPRTKGKTWIGCVIDGVKDGKRRRYTVYNTCDHEECFRETGAQAVSYTTGVPAMIGAKMILEKKWTSAGVFNVEEFDPDPFMADLKTYGLPWKESVEDLEDGFDWESDAIHKVGF
jgi:saccharopine dehydrogenase (NAD+, L-lysine-forming)